MKRCKVKALAQIDFVKLIVGVTLKMLSLLARRNASVEFSHDGLKDEQMKHCQKRNIIIIIIKISFISTQVIYIIV